MPLSHFIIKDTPSPDDGKNRDVQIIHQESLVINMFTGDSIKVIDIINELTLGTDYETCINGLNFGIKSMQDIQYHYDGTSEVVQRKQVYGAQLRRIFYKNETTLTFEKYVTKIKGYLICWIHMVFHSMKSRFWSIYYTKSCHKIQS